MPYRVLVVEDSPTMRAFVAASLESDGQFEVIQTASGFGALQALPGGRFDVIVTDVNMPDINGLELIKFVRGNAAYVRTPLIIISTEGRERDRDRGLLLGANAYLVKPFAPEELLEIVRRLAAGAPGAG